MLIIHSYENAEGVEHAQPGAAAGRQGGLRHAVAASGEELGEDQCMLQCVHDVDVGFRNPEVNVEVLCWLLSWRVCKDSMIKGD